MILPVKGTAAMGVDLSGIDQGDSVELVAEPTNPHDPRAIRVEHQGRLVGYLAKEFAAAHSAADYSAFVCAVLPHPETGIPAGLRISVQRVEQGADR